MSDSGEVYDDEYYRNLPVNSGRIDTLLRLLEFASTDTVCEIGCAAGHFLIEIAPKIRLGVGIDTAHAAITAAKQIKSRLGINNIEFMNISVQDYANNGDFSASFDFVFLLDVTEHIADDVLTEVLLAAKQLLKQEGTLTIHTPNLNYWLERLKDIGIISQLSGHIAVRTRQHYLDLIEQAGFDKPQVLGLPHYRQPLRMIDSLMMWIPFIGRFFRSRLFIVARHPYRTRDMSE